VKPVTKSEAPPAPDVPPVANLTTTTTSGGDRSTFTVARDRCEICHGGTSGAGGASDFVTGFTGGGGVAGAGFEDSVS